MPVKKHKYTTGVAKRFIEALDMLKGEGKAPVSEIHAKIGILPSYVSHINSGLKFPTIEHLVKLSSYYKFSAEWLLLGRGEPRWDEKTENINERLDRMDKMMDTMSDLVSSMLVRGITGSSIGIGSSLGPKKK